MRGLGTLANVTLIIIGGLIGYFSGSKLPKRSQETLMLANGVAVLFIGVAGAMAGMLKVQGRDLTTSGTLMMTISLALGSVIGELIDIDGKMEKFGEWLKRKTGNAKDRRFVDGFVSCSLTVCVGAMAIIGSIQDGISGDHSVLIAKGILDFVIVLVMTASLGKGCIFSAIPVGIFQGLVTLLAVFLEPIITKSALTDLSLVGSILIFLVGVNLVWDRKNRVANMLPAVLIAALWSYIF